MSASRNAVDDGCVIIERTSVFFVALDKYGRIHMGFDAFREGNVLTLPGGKIEKSDRNLYVAARRETKQEFGKHMRYALICPEPYVFLCSMEDDSLVTNPYPGQRVKLRVVWFVMELDDHIPLEQKSREVLEPRAYHISAARLEELPMRESSRIAIREAFARGLMPNPQFQYNIKPDMASMRQQMIDCRVPLDVCNHHGLRRVHRSPRKLAGPFGMYLHQLDIAEKERNRLMRRRRSKMRGMHRELRGILKPGTARNKRYLAESERILDHIHLELRASLMPA